MGLDDLNREKASVVQAERELKALKAEKASLAKELQEVRSLYKQLVDEAPLESYHEKRVHLLKSQVIQLERQVLLLSDALSSRSEVLLFVENSLLSISDKLSNHLRSDTKSPSVAIERNQLVDLIQTAEGARHRLYRNVEANFSERLCGPLLYMGPFLKPNAMENGVTLLDVCSGQIDHLNLKQVAKLESKLFSLKRQLHSLHQSLIAVWSSEPHHSMQSFSHHLPLAVQQRLFGQLTQCQRSIADSCNDLLSLSILVPSAPWPLITKPVNCEPSLDSVMAALPSVPKSKQQQVHACIDALMKACTYSRKVAKLEAKACADELHFHQSLYDIQLKYIKSVFTGIREAYDEFEQNTQELLCQPLSKILEAYSSLAGSSSEDTLREFLTTFKAYANELEKVLHMLTINSSWPSSGHKVLSTHGKDFFDTVDAVVEKCCLERDELAKEIDSVRQMEEDHRKHGLSVFDRPKPGIRTAKEEFQEGIQEVHISETPDNSADPAFTTNKVVSSKGNPKTDTAGSVTESNDGKSFSPKLTPLKSLGCKTPEGCMDIPVQKGPRTIQKGSPGFPGFKTSHNQTLSTPNQKDVVREGITHAPMAASGIPRSGSLSRLKPPSPRHSSMTSKTKEGNRHLRIAHDNNESRPSNIKRSSSEGSRLGFKSAGAEPGS